MNNDASAQHEIKISIRSWYLAPSLWFGLAGVATFFGFLNCVLSGVMNMYVQTEVKVPLRVLLAFGAVLFGLFWEGLYWLAIWKRWSHAGRNRNRYLGWTYGQGGLILLRCVGVFISVLTMPLLTGFSAQITGKSKLFPFLLGGIALSIISVVVWILQTIAMPKKTLLPISETGQQAEDARETTRG